jgi:hypothetical protein
MEANKRTTGKEERPTNKEWSPTKKKLKKW